MNRQRGFTLVELLTVVTIVGLVMAMAAMAMRPSQGDKMRSFSRSLLGAANEARQSAIALRQSARIKIETVSNSLVVQVETRDPSGNWLNTAGALRAPREIQACVPKSPAGLAAETPTCPLTTTQYVCYSPSGAVTLKADGACDDNATGTGAILFVRTSDALMKYKVVIFGLTGMPRLIDAW